MTNNIEKLYELAKVEKTYRVDIGIWSNELNKRLPSIIHIPEKDIKSYENKETTPIIDYFSPPFTDTKQLNLIKWLAKLGEFEFCLEITHNSFDIFTFYFKGIRVHEHFEQALAGLVCELWEDLTEQQREEVRGILE